jgi:hypothetical protein
MQRSNRVAWGLVIVLAVVLLRSAWPLARLGGLDVLHLQRQDWGFGRLPCSIFCDGCWEDASWFRLGVIAVRWQRCPERRIIYVSPGELQATRGKSRRR